MRRSNLVGSIFLVLAATLSPRPSEAAITTVKPDLKVVSIGPSSVGGQYLRVVVTNAGFGWSGVCGLRVTNSSSAALYYAQIPALAPITIYPGTSTVALDVYVGGFGSGTYLHAIADCWQNVVETKEDNNDLWYIAP